MSPAPATGPDKAGSSARRDRNERGAEVALQSDGLTIRAHRGDPPPTAAVGTPAGIIILHAFPAAPQGAEAVFLTFPELAERIAFDTGCPALAIAFRGCAGSEGDASAQGFLADVRAGIASLRADPAVGRIHLIGFGVGGAVALVAAAADPTIGGVAVLACPADLDQWASDPRRMLEHCRSLGAVSTPGFPHDVNAWARELGGMRAIDHVGGLGERPLLIVHGTEDETTPVIDARALADAAHLGGSEPELRLLAGASHDLRHDPRAIAILLGWIERLG